MIKVKTWFAPFCAALILSSLSIHAFCAGEMVEISVEITEVNTTKANQLGITWTNAIQAGEVSWSNGSRIPSALPEVPSIIQVGDFARYTALSAQLKFLESKGAAQILSNPKILTKSGTSAKVIVGGEMAVVATGVSGGTIQWKEYGIKSEVQPRILPDDYIDLVLTTEVSRLDYANQAGGYPSISKREATSNIKVKSGQTITIAGLIDTQKQNSSSGIPLLSDIPVLGHLFSHKTINETKSNVLIFVTPKIVD
jgi:pilus assembly protein CpaC